ncbi:hypothetical protein B0H16DRAFT_1520721 [Mycena metata]|uniref:Uncharacterized protein n=1 Tax=Mycena metata TaxID=1033252 RepID=A0AAD7NMB9_9AGAR|nr:hypothetical protein B0H16DRAFT_1520721 [Mycena metata]
MIPIPDLRRINVPVGRPPTSCTNMYTPLIGHATRQPSPPARKVRQAYLALISWPCLSLPAHPTRSAPAISSKSPRRTCNTIRARVLSQFHVSTGRRSSVSTPTVRAAISVQTHTFPGLRPAARTLTFAHRPHRAAARRRELAEDAEMTPPALNASKIPSKTVPMWRMDGPPPTSAIHHPSGVLPPRAAIADRRKLRIHCVPALGRNASSPLSLLPTPAPSICSARSSMPACLRTKLQARAPHDHPLRASSDDDDTWSFLSGMGLETEGRPRGTPSSSFLVLVLAFAQGSPPAALPPTAPGGDGVD